MANVIKYIDISASAGGDGSQGSPYNSHVSALSAELSGKAIGDNLIFYVADGDYSGDYILVPTGIATSATGRIQFFAESKHGVYLSRNTAYQRTVYFQSAYCELYGYALSNPTTNGYGVVASAGYSLFKNCLFRGFFNIALDMNDNTGSNTVIAINCEFYQNPIAVNVAGNTTAGKYNIRNCVFLNNTTGLNVTDYRQVTVANTYIGISATANITLGTSAVLTKYRVWTDDGDESTYTETASDVFTTVTAGSEDAHLPDDSPLIDYGLEFHYASVYPFSDDADGNPRGKNDIGPYENQNVGAEASPNDGITYWYVDKNVSNPYGAGDGTDWAFAWSELNEIVWAGISAGDVVMVSGGASGQTYSTQIYPTVSGSEGSPVIIQKATATGHNGAVSIIDLTNPTVQPGEVQHSGVYLYNRSYITIDGFYIDYSSDYDSPQTSTAGHAVWIQSCTGIVVKNCEIVSRYGKGLYQYGSSACEIDNCYMWTIVSDDTGLSQSDYDYIDACFFQAGSGNVIHDCTMRNSTPLSVTPIGHSDVFQSYQEEDFTMYNCRLILDAQVTTARQILFIQDSRGFQHIYNNIVDGSTSDSDAQCVNLEAYDVSSYVLFRGNTIIGKNSQARIDVPTGSFIQNNIFWRMTAGTDVAYYTYGGSPTLNNNLYFNSVYAVGDGTPVNWNTGSNSFITFSAHLAANETNSLYGNPLIRLASYQIKTGSPAIDTADNSLGSPYNLDIDGIDRLSTWNIGAIETIYESSSSVDIIRQALIFEAIKRRNILCQL